MDDIDKFIDENRYVGHSFTKSIIAGKPTTQAIAQWAVQKYYQTYLQNTAFSHIHAQAQHILPIREFMVEQLIDEETSEGEGSAPHFELMRRFALACGAEPDQMTFKNVAKPVRHFVDYLTTHCASSHPVLGMLAIYVNERQTPSASDALYAALRSHYNKTEEDLEWFAVHGSADIEHSQRARSLIMTYADDVDNFDKSAMQVVQNGMRQWQELQNFYSTIIR